MTILTLLTELAAWLPLLPFVLLLWAILAAGLVVIHCAPAGDRREGR